MKKTALTSPGPASELDLAISSWKKGHSTRPEAILSAAARTRILARAADRSHRQPSFRTLFFPWNRLVLAGALPVLLLIALTATVGHLARQAPGLEGLATLQSPPIFASKTAGEVIFTIANGNRAHRVYASTAPDRFEGVPAVLTRDGAFRDSLSNGPDLVYYRID